MLNSTLNTKQTQITVKSLPGPQKTAKRSPSTRHSLLKQRVVELPPSLALLCPYTNSVISYSVTSNSTRTFRAKGEKLAVKAAWAVTDDGNFLISGRRRTRTEKVMIFSLLTGQVEKLTIWSLPLQPQSSEFRDVCVRYRRNVIFTLETMWEIQYSDQSLGNLAVGRFCHGTCVHSCRVYVAGGQNVDPVEIRNTVSDKFLLAKLKIMPFSCVILPAGKISLSFRRIAWSPWVQGKSKILRKPKKKCRARL